MNDQTSTITHSIPNTPSKDACPYPGARPLRGTDSPGLLRGRDVFGDDLMIDIATKKVVELTASSGVGKSSLLAARVIPTLRQRGARVALLSSWGSLGEGPDQDCYARAVTAAVYGGETEGIDGGGLHGSELLDHLQSRYDSALVLVFDQLEELFRDDPTVGRRFVRAVARSAIERPFHHVLSMRSEYKVELEQLEQIVEPESWRWHNLSPIEPDIVPEIISEPAAQAVAPFGYTEDAIDSICSWWSAARNQAWQIGLLQLQAFLWVTWQRLGPEAGSVITLTELQDQWPDAPPGPIDPHHPSAAEQVIRLFDRALQDYARLRLGTSSNQTTDLDRERLFAAARIVPQLSSGGYKLVRESVELAEVAIPGLADLLLPPDFLSRAISAARSLSENDSGVTGSSDLTAARLLEQLTISAGSEEPALLGPTVGDRMSSAGRLKGEPASVTGCALVASFENALQLLARESIVRFTPTAGGIRVAMVHDGFGLALKAWSGEILEDPLMTLESLTMISAKELFTHAPLPESSELGSRPVPAHKMRFGSDLSTGENGIARIENVGWISCYVKADFHGVIFENSDLRSTLFRSCSFENVVFKNCQMWGSLFVDCEFQGADGVTITGPMSIPTRDGGADPGVKTITFNLCRLSGGGLTIKGVAGYGVFFDACSGGPWRIEESRLLHVMVNIETTDQEQAGLIVGSDISYLSRSGANSLLPKIQGPEVKYFDQDAWIISSG